MRTGKKSEGSTIEMNMEKTSLSRKEFIKLAALGVSGIAFRPIWKLFSLPDFPAGERLGRICYGRWDLKAAPDYDSQNVGMVFDDQVLPWIKEVPGKWPFRNNQRWVETPDGYIWSSYFQPVRNQPNVPISSLPQGATGMWVEVTVPYVDLIMINPPPRHPFFKDRFENSLPLRFYYSQILWVDQIKVDDDGAVWYRVNERYGNRGDIYWADGRAFRPISNEEISPINPDVMDKRIVVDISTQRQELSCFEGNNEVYYCRISSGKATGSTPIGSFNVFNKYFSLHMEGGTAVAGWDTGGVGWSSIFATGGVAIHSTYWHNNYGEEESNGCVNVSPDDAKWIFRWSSPGVEYSSGNKTVSDYTGTQVRIVQAA